MVSFLVAHFANIQLIIYICNYLSIAPGQQRFQATSHQRFLQPVILGILWVCHGNIKISRRH